ncbi:MAG: PEP-CTERM sorting domain-containing protein [Planctomycetales bacterium]|nr:PEP-CTERM sorting domain-containing protein [Planctomycetales bacterium]
MSSRNQVAKLQVPFSRPDRAGSLHVVPEPSTFALLSLAGTLAASRCRRRLYMR